MLVAFNKPYGVLTQFTDKAVPPRPTLAGFGLPRQVYAAGRLDHDSEGLLLLSDDGRLIQTIADPRWKWPKVYAAQVEGVITGEALARLRRGVALRDGLTAPAEAEAMDAPGWLWPRDPPIRFRKSVPDAWLQLTIREGRNRQVRRMTAAVGLPTLRLIRIAVGPHALDGLAPGAWRQVDAALRPPAPTTTTSRARRWRGAGGRA